jgi:L-amino acid N-acyltransferase YncA
MNESSEIRLVTPEDYAGILEIYAHYVRETVITFDYEVPTVDEWRKKIETISAKYPYLVCIHQNKIVGFAYASDFRHKIAYQWSPETTIYVAEGFHGKKIGKTLYTALLDLLKQQGFYNVYGIITVPNEPSVKLHHAMGFVPVGTFKNVGYKFDAWRDTYWCVLTLHEHGDNPAPPKPPVKEFKLTF